MQPAVAADADTSSLDDTSSLEVAVAAVAALVRAGYGPPVGAGSTPAGLSLHLRLRYLLLRQINPHRQRRLPQKVTGISTSHELNSGWRRPPELSFASSASDRRPGV